MRWPYGTMPQLMSLEAFYMPRQRRRFLLTMFSPYGSMERMPFLVATLVLLIGLLPVALGGYAVLFANQGAARLFFGYTDASVSASTLLTLAIGLLFVHGVFTYPFVCMVMQRLRQAGCSPVPGAAAALLLLWCGGFFHGYLHLAATYALTLFFFALLAWPEEADQRPGGMFRRTLGVLFSPFGSMGRLQFLGAGMVLEVGIQAPLALFASYVTTLDLSGDSSMPELLSVSAGLLCGAAAYLYIYACITMKRLRRAGKKPLIAVLATAALLACRLGPEDGALFLAADYAASLFLLVLLCLPDTPDEAQYKETIQQ